MKRSVRQCTGRIIKRIHSINVEDAASVSTNLELVLFGSRVANISIIIARVEVTLIIPSGITKLFSLVIRQVLFKS